MRQMLTDASERFLGYAPGMKAYSSIEVLLTRLVIFISLSGFCICCHAQPGSWNVVFAAPAPVPITGMAYGNGTFVGVGGGFRLISYNGSNWTAYATPPIINNGGVAFGSGMFLMFGTNSQYKANYVFQSTNGTAWTTIYSSSNTLLSAAYGNNTWVFIGTNEIATATMTSSNWNWSEFQPPFSPACITYGNGVFVIGAYIGSYYYILSSSDGVAWQYDSSPIGLVNATIAPSLGIAYGNGVFLTSAGFPSSSACYYFVSSNLVQWNLSWGFSATSSSYPVTYGGNQFIVAIANNLYTSSDGYGWVNSRNSIGTYNVLTYGQGTFVACNYLANPAGASIQQSGVFFTNSSAPPATLGICTYPGVTINGTAGGVYQIQYTTNLNNSSWQTLTNFMLPYSPYLWIDTSLPVNGHKFYRSAQLQ